MDAAYNTALFQEDMYTLERIALLVIWVNVLKQWVRINITAKVLRVVACTAGSH